MHHSTLKAEIRKRITKGKQFDTIADEMQRVLPDLDRKKLAVYYKEELRKAPVSLQKDAIIVKVRKAIEDNIGISDFHWQMEQTHNDQYNADMRRLAEKEYDKRLNAKPVSDIAEQMQDANNRIKKAIEIIRAIKDTPKSWTYTQKKTHGQLLIISKRLDKMYKK